MAWWWDEEGGGTESGKLKHVKCPNYISVSGGIINAVLQMYREARGDTKYAN